MSIVEEGAVALALEVVVGDGGAGRVVGPPVAEVDVEEAVVVAVAEALGDARDDAGVGGVRLGNIAIQDLATT